MISKFTKPCNAKGELLAIALCEKCVIISYFKMIKNNAIIKRQGFEVE